MMRTLGSIFRVFAAPSTQFTGISVRTNRKYLSNFLAIALAISGLQAIAISSAPTASALTWTNVTGLTVRGNLNHIRTSNDGSVIGAISKGQNNSNLGDLYLSRDSGASWTTSTADRYTSNGLYKLAVSGDGSLVIAGDDSYIYRASYSGSTWSYSTRTWRTQQVQVQINAVPDMAPISTPLQPALMGLIGLLALVMKVVCIHRPTLVRIGLTQISGEPTGDLPLVQMAQ